MESKQPQVGKFTEPALVERKALLLSAVLDPLAAERAVAVFRAVLADSQQAQVYLLKLGQDAINSWVGPHCSPPQKEKRKVRTASLAR